MWLIFEGNQRLVATNLCLSHYPTSIELQFYLWFEVKPMPQLLIDKFHYYFNANSLNCALLKTLAYEIFPNTLMVDTLLLHTC